MAKNSMQQIQKDEKKIIAELSKNSNKSINEIAKSCNFSRQKVWRIIKNLEKNNTIWGYVAVTDDEKLDKQEFIVLIKRTNNPIEGDIVDKFINRDVEKDAMQAEVEINTSIYVNGVFDWVICFSASDIRCAKRFCEGLNRQFSGHIQETFLLEKMFATKKCGIKNPEVSKIKDFF